MGKSRGETINSFWKDRRVLVTGFSGFLGSWLTKRLVGAGAKVTGIDMIIKRPLSVLTDDDLNRINTIKGNVEDYAFLLRAIRSSRPAYIFHLAAKSLVGDCLRKPLEAFSTNVIGTCNILEASRLSGGMEGIIIASSDKAYGSHKKLPYKEDYPLRGDHPYDVSKSCADLISYSYYNTFKLPVCVMRCGNIYGPGDFNFSRIVPDAVVSAIKGKVLKIRSSGRFTRDYVYVEDVVNGYLLLAEAMGRKRLYGEAFNLSDEKPTSVLELVKSIHALVRGKAKYKVLNIVRDEIVDQNLSALKAKQILGWEPQWTLREGLKKTVRWYGDHIKDIPK